MPYKAHFHCQYFYRTFPYFIVNTFCVYNCKNKCHHFCLYNENELCKDKIGDNKNYSYELIKLKSINPEHKLTLETDYDKVKRFAEYFKETSEVEKWVEEIKKHIFVEIKL